MTPISPGKIILSGLCIGCGACAVGEPRAAMVWDRYGQLKPEGPRDWREAATPEFAARCPFSPSAANEDAIAAARFPDAPHRDAHIGRHISAHVGAAAEPPFRAQGSSGGMVSWVAAELLRGGEVDGVLHVHPGDEGEQNVDPEQVLDALEDGGGGGAPGHPRSHHDDAGTGEAPEMKASTAS